MLKPQDLLRRILFTEKSIKNIHSDIQVLQQEKYRAMLEYDNKIKAKRDKLNRAKQYQLSLLQPQAEQGIDKNIFEPEENTIQYFIDKYGLEVFDGAEINILSDYKGFNITSKDISHKTRTYRKLCDKEWNVRTVNCYSYCQDGLHNSQIIRLIKKGGKYAKDN